MFLSYVFLDILRAHRLVGSVCRVEGAENQSENRINEAVNKGSRRHYRQEHCQQSDVVQCHSYGKRLQPVTTPGHRLSRQKIADSRPMNQHDRQFARSRSVFLEDFYRRSMVFSRFHRIVNLFPSISLSLSRYDENVSLFPKS